MTTTPHQKNAVSFEKATARLEQIVEKLDAPDTPLEQMISLVEEGLALIRSSKEILHNAELRIRVLEAPDTDTKEESLHQEDEGFSLQ